MTLSVEFIKLRFVNAVVAHVLLLKLCHSTSLHVLLNRLEVGFELSAVLTLLAFLVKLIFCRKLGVKLGFLLCRWLWNVRFLLSTVGCRNKRRCDLSVIL